MKASDASESEHRPVVAGRGHAAQAGIAVAVIAVSSGFLARGALVLVLYSQRDAVIVGGKNAGIGRGAACNQRKRERSGKKCPCKNEESPEGFYCLWPLNGTQAVLVPSFPGGGFA